MPTQAQADKQLARIRKICNSYPETTEKISHGQPTFFAGGKKVFLMFMYDHHEDGRLGIWIPAPQGAQEILTEAEPETYFIPPYVGHRGHIGIHLTKIDAATLKEHIHEAWQIVAPKKLQQDFLGD